MSDVEIVVCEHHGLRYNAATQQGCARCRKETGELGTAAAEAVPEDPRIGLALLVTAGLILLTSSMFYWAHRQVSDVFQSVAQEAGLVAAPIEDDDDPLPYWNVEEIREVLDDPDSGLTGTERRDLRLRLERLEAERAYEDS